MNSFLKSAAWIGLAVSTGGVPVLAQMRDNTDKQLSCSNGGYDGERARHCEVREQTLPSIGRLTVDAAQNGGATVKGWLRSDVLVRARIDAQAANQGAAAVIASQVMIDGSGGQVRATGPERNNNESSWSVSYEIFVPQVSDLTLKAHNGGINISDVHGQIHFDTVNGGVNLKRVAGELSGGTVNGGIDIELASAVLDSRPMELSTHNGGVTIAMPGHYSARIQAETGMGRIDSDFPMPQEATGRARKLDFNIGAGGPPIHITTGNGSIKLKRSDATQ